MTTNPDPGGVPSRHTPSRHTPSRHTLIQLSDIHLLPGDALLHGAVDTLANLRVALDMVVAAGAPVSGVLLTGDLADGGSREAYRALRTLVEPMAARLGAPVVYAMGNHDDREAFRRELLSAPDTGGPCDSVHWIGGLRILVLDSTTPTRHDGKLEDDQLRWLSEHLAQPAPDGTVLVIHHPPLPSPVPAVHLLRLRDAERLAEVVAGTDVSIILSGHAHHASAGVLAGIPVWVAPAVAYQLDPMAPSGRMRGHAGGAFSRIDLISGTAVATAVPIRTGSGVWDTDEAEFVRQVRDHVARVG